MRVLLLALMIALLPLRGWIGDVMAMEMASAYATGARASSSLHAGASHSECHDAATTPGASLNTPEPQDTATHGDCSDCSACQICHTAAVTSAIRPDVHATLPPWLPAQGSVQFASATPAPRLKPPIS